MDDDMIKIQLTIGNNPFPLTIRRKDEETVRKAAKQVDNLTNAYKAHYPELPEVRILQMVAYQLSLEGLKEKGRNDTTPYTEKIQELTQLVDDCINK
jgi:cell division protein ZapA